MTVLELRIFKLVVLTMLGVLLALSVTWRAEGQTLTWEPSYRGGWRGTITPHDTRSMDEKIMDASRGIGAPSYDIYIEPDPNYRPAYQPPVFWPHGPAFQRRRP